MSQEHFEGGSSIFFAWRVKDWLPATFFFLGWELVGNMSYGVVEVKQTSKGCSPIAHSINKDPDVDGDKSWGEEVNKTRTSWLVLRCCLFCRLAQLSVWEFFYALTVDSWKLSIVGQILISLSYKLYTVKVHFSSSLTFLQQHFSHLYRWTSFQSLYARSKSIS